MSKVHRHIPVQWGWGARARSQSENTLSPDHNRNTEQYHTHSSLPSRRLENVLNRGELRQLLSKLVVDQYGQPLPAPIMDTRQARP
jgi:hypothetical protein